MGARRDGSPWQRRGLATAQTSYARAGAAATAKHESRIWLGAGSATGMKQPPRLSNHASVVCLLAAGILSMGCLFQSSSPGSPVEPVPAPAWQVGDMWVGTLVMIEHDLTSGRTRLAYTNATRIVLDGPTCESGPPKEPCFYVTLLTGERDGSFGMSIERIGTTYLADIRGPNQTGIGIPFPLKLGASGPFENGQYEIKERARRATSLGPLWLYYIRYRAEDDGGEWTIDTWYAPEVGATVRRHTYFNSTTKRVTYEEAVLNSNRVPGPGQVDPPEEWRFPVRFPLWQKGQMWNFSQEITIKQKVQNSLPGRYVGSLALWTRAFPTCHGGGQCFYQVGYDMLIERGGSLSGTTRTGQLEIDIETLEAKALTFPGIPFPITGFYFASMGQASYEIQAVENVSTPAGTFASLRIRYEEHANQLSTTGVLWYSPQVEWFVRHEFHQDDGVQEVWGRRDITSRSPN